MVLQCARRFDELKSTGGFPHVDNQCNALTEGSTSPSDALSTLLDTGEVVETGSRQSSKVTGQFYNVSYGSDCGSIANTHKDFLNHV